MKKRELGKSGIYVSELGFGAMSLPNEVQEVQNIFSAALHAGINFFDTADLYGHGRNEELLSHLLNKRRDEIILATKVGNEMNDDGKTWTWNPSKNHITNAVKESLVRLKTDYIDLYQLHGGMMEDDIDETIDAFEGLKKEGLIRHYGISSIRPTVIKRFLDKSTAVSVMMQYSLLDRRPEEWFTMIENAGASIITRGTLAKGLLTLNGLKKVNRSKGFAMYNEAELPPVLQSLHKNSEDIHAAAIGFPLESQVISSTLVGASSTQQLLDSIIAYEKQSSPDEIKTLKEIARPHKYKEHRLD